MKGSAVQAFRSLASKIHPPVSLTQQESNRLLTALTSSFQRQLDLEHPIQSIRSTTGFKPVRSESSKMQRTDSLAESHLVSVLTNPLIARSDIQDGLERSQGQKHPIRIFEEHVARGIATLDTAKLCLDAFRSSLIGSTSEQRQKAISQTRAGASVLRWIWSTSQPTGNVFTYDMKLVTLLSEFLIAEGKEEAMWRWMGKVDHQITIKRPGREPIKAYSQALLLRSIIMAHLSLDAERGVKAALNAYVRMLDSCDLPQFKAVGSSSKLLRPAGRYLTRVLRGLYRPASSDLECGTLFDRLIESCSIWARSEGDAIYRSALLQACHPVTLNAGATLRLLQFLNRHPTDLLLSQYSGERPSLLRLLFDSVDILQAQNHHDDAAWVMEFMRNNFSGDLVGAQNERKSVSTETRRRHRESASNGKSSSPDILRWGVPIPG